MGFPPYLAKAKVTVFNNYKIKNFCGFILEKKFMLWSDNLKMSSIKKKTTHNSFGVLIKKSCALAVHSV